ncbi:MAG: class I SAM-dependent methyltransferase [Anaerolineae bacterium]
MGERRYGQEIARLRGPERLARLEVDRVVDLCQSGFPKPESMLDVGTGSGVFAEAFAARGLNVAGIDVDAAMLDAARAHLSAGRLVQASAEELPLVDQAVDLAFLGLLLHEADDALRVLREARRVARQRVAILEWPYREEEAGPPLAHRLRGEQVTALVEQAGLICLQEHSLQSLVLYLGHVQVG